MNIVCVYEHIQLNGGMSVLWHSTRSIVQIQFPPFFNCMKYNYSYNWTSFSSIVWNTIEQTHTLAIIHTIEVILFKLYGGTTELNSFFLIVFFLNWTTSAIKKKEFNCPHTFIQLYLECVYVDWKFHLTRSFL